MNQDYLEIENSEGMPKMADSSFALDFLLSIKNGIRNYAIALTETANPEVRNFLAKQMEEEIDLHGEVSELMINRGWLHPHDVGEQFKLDLKSAQMAVTIAKMNLFSKDTSRLGTFATPEK